VEIILILALGSLLWLLWQVYRAKQFNKFKRTLIREIKPKVIADIEAELEQSRSELFPNNEAHQAATIYYWSQYPARILQAALFREIVDEKWLKDTGNWRNSQHLFHVGQHQLNPVLKQRSE